MTRAMALTGIAVVVAAGLTISAAAGTLTLSDGFDYSIGNYGEAQPTEIFFDSASAKYEFGMTTLKLTVPYLWVNGPANVIPGVGPISGKTGQRVMRSGIGDVFVGGSQGFSLPFLPGTEIKAGGKIKLATASAAAGLGTGHNDYFAEVSISHDFGDGWQAMAGGGRRFTGMPEGSGLRDVWYGSVGGSWSFNSDQSVAVMFDARQPLSATTGSDIDAMVAFSQKFLTDWKVSVYGAKGMSSDAAAFETGLIVSRKFSFP